MAAEPLAQGDIYGFTIKVRRHACIFRSVYQLPLIIVGMRLGSSLTLVSIAYRSCPHKSRSVRTAQPMLTVSGWHGPPWKRQSSCPQARAKLRSYAVPVRIHHTIAVADFPALARYHVMLLHRLMVSRRRAHAAEPTAVFGLVQASP